MRLAEGVFDAVTTWNGCAKALYPASAGVVPLGATRGVAADAEGPAVPLQAGWSTWRLGSLLPEVHALGLDSRLFAAPFRDLDAACLEGELAFFDLVVAVDAEAERAVDALIEEVFGSEPKSKAWSRRKVVRLEDFLTYLPREFALKAGASGVLGPRLRKLLETTAEDGRTLYGESLAGVERGWQCRLGRGRAGYGACRGRNVRDGRDRGRGLCRARGHAVGRLELDGRTASAAGRTPLLLLWLWAATCSRPPALPSRCLQDYAVRGGAAAMPHGPVSRGSRRAALLLSLNVLS